ncbi:MarR family transcriptional regulator [Nocardiopsis composta]
MERSEDSAPRTDPPLPVPEGLPEGVVDAVAASGGEVVFREFLSAIVLNAQAIADRLGLRLIDVQAAHLVTQAGPLTAGALAERLGTPTATTTRVIDRLERAGYVRRVRDPHDRRRVAVEAVPGGMGEADAMFEPTRRHLAALGERYTPEQVALMFDMFTFVTRAFKDATAEIRRGGEGR